MKLIDMHCDTLGKLIDINEPVMLGNSETKVNLELLKKSDSLAQFFACFTYAEDFKNCGGYDAAYEKSLKMISLLEKQEEMYNDRMKIVSSKKEILQAEKEGKISAFLTIEEGGILNGQIDRLEMLHKKNVKLMTLMWNFENCLGYPNSRENEIMQKGLKPFGREVVECMGECQMIVDVSHASDGSFWDIIHLAKGPVVASHSNCRELCAHPRNLSDEMIRALAEKGGVAGLNFYGVFLGSPKASKIEEMTAHILHMIKIGGSEFPAIGTDFDGFDGMDSMEIADIGEIEKLWHSLKKKGISEEQLDKIWYQNVLKIL